MQDSAPVHLKGPSPFNATSVAKCKQLMSLCLSLPLEKFGNQCNSKGGKKKFKCKNVTISVQKSNQKGGQQERECICVSRNSVNRSKTSVVPRYVHVPLVSSLESGYYTSLEIKKKAENNINTHIRLSKEMLNLKQNSISLSTSYRGIGNNMTFDIYDFLKKLSWNSILSHFLWLYGILYYAFWHF